MLKVLAAPALALCLSLSPAAAQEGLAPLLQPFVAAPTGQAAGELAQRLFDLAGEGQWQAISAVTADALGPLLEHLPDDRALEVLLLTVQAQGEVGATALRDQMITLADDWGATLPGETAAVLSINLGYVLLQTGAPDLALARLAPAIEQAERTGDGDGLMNLCGLGSQSFERFGYMEQAAAIYQTCDQSAFLRQTSLPGRGIFWHNYASFLQGQGDLQLAITRHQWALNELAAQFGFPSAQVVDAYDALSQTLLAAGDLGSADTVAQLALTYSEELGLPQTSDAHWRVVNNAAAIKRALRQPREAQALDRAAFIWRRDAFGLDHPLTLASWMNYALDLAEMQAWEEAHAQFVSLYQRQEAGEPVPYSHAVLSYYLYYIDARIAFEKGEEVNLPSIEPLLQGGAPMELIAGVTDLVVAKLLAKNDVPWAIDVASGASQLMALNLVEGHPLRFEADLLHARALAAQDPAAATELLSKTEIDLFNWTRRQALSGSYDASIAARGLADDLLLFMARHTQTDPAFQPYFAHALHRWKTLSSPSDRAVSQVLRSRAPQELKQATRAYGLAAARFRETVRAEPVSEMISTMDADLATTREALNPRLAAHNLPLLEAPLAPLPAGPAPAFDVQPQDIVIDIIALRDWTSTDQSGWAERLELFAAIHRDGAPPQVEQITTLDFTANGDVYEKLWADLGAWFFAQSDGAARVFLAPDAMLFQMDLTAARSREGQRLGEAFDVFLLSDRSAYAGHDAQGTLDAGDQITAAGGLYYSQLGADDPSYLPGSLAEIDHIDALAGELGARVKRLQGFDATTKRVVDAAEASQVLHLATHGFFTDTTDAPYSLQNAGLLLSSEGAPARTYATDVMGWDLSGVELVVLSACQSGVGPNTPIDAVRGLPLSLARAGAARSLVTLAEIPDQQTTLIMQRYYRYLTVQKLDYATAFLSTKRDIWAGRIEDVPAHTAGAFVFYTH